MLGWLDDEAWLDDGVAMKITLPTDCGNAPRMVVVAEFTVSWATGDTAALSDTVAENVDWTVAGGGTLPREPKHLDVRTIVTHGRHASCDGYVTQGERTVSFFHMIRFASAAKTAKIVEIRSYVGEVEAS